MFSKLKVVSVWVNGVPWPDHINTEKNHWESFIPTICIHSSGFWNKSLSCLFWKVERSRKLYIKESSSWFAWRGLLALMAELAGSWELRGSWLSCATPGPGAARSLTQSLADSRSVKCNNQSSDSDTQSRAGKIWILFLSNLNHEHSAFDSCRLIFQDSI